MPQEDASDRASDLCNYAKLGPAGAFSGPIVGAMPGVRRHVKELKKIPGAKDVYLA